MLQRRFWTGPPHCNTRRKAWADVAGIRVSLTGRVVALSDKLFAPLNTATLEETQQNQIR